MAAGQQAGWIEEKPESHKFLRGKDYPNLCDRCKQIINSVADMYEEGLMEDTDDIEAPIMYVYDHKMYCGEHECENKSERIL